MIGWSPQVVKVLSWATIIWIIVFIVGRLFPGLRKWGITIGPFYVMFRVRRFVSFLDWMASRNRLAWLVFLEASIPLGIGQMLFAYYWLSRNLIGLIIPRGGGAPVYPLIPGITIGPSALKYFIPAILVILVTHECAHGVAARLGHIRIRSMGVIVAFLMLGAFVEPDEEELERAPLRVKLRVLSAGSAANLLVGLMLLLLTGALFIQTPSGIVVVGTLEGYPAHGKIAPFSVIIELNSTKVNSVAELAEFMKNSTPGSRIIVRLIDPTGAPRVVILKLAPRPDDSTKGFMGIRIADYNPPRIPMPPRVSLELMWLLMWTHMLCLSAAILNMLPIYPFDGGRIMFMLTDEYIKNRTVNMGIKSLLTVSSAALLIVNMILTLIKFSIPT